MKGKILNKPIVFFYCLICFVTIPFISIGSELPKVDDLELYRLLTQATIVFEEIPSASKPRSVFEIKAVKTGFSHEFCTENSVKYCNTKALYIAISLAELDSPHKVYVVKDGYDWEFKEWKKEIQKQYVNNIAVFQMRKKILENGKFTWKTVEFSVNPLEGNSKIVD